MRIMLIQPRMNMRPMDTKLKTRMSPSLALYTLLNLTPEGHEVRIVNENAEDIDYDWPAELVGITVTLDVMPRAAEIAARFRLQSVPVVAGGIHISCCPHMAEGAFDSLLIGPAERIWAQVIDDVARGRLRGSYCDMEGFSGEEIASPDYAAIPRDKYLYYNVVTTSRGCPNCCDFCYNSSHNRMYVRRPIPYVLNDIRALGTKYVLFIDDNFIGSPEYTRDLLQAISGMGLTYGAAVTAGILDHPDILDTMAATGCQTLFIGFESINEESLNSVNKRNSIARYEQLIDAIHKRGIMVNASMVFGLDGDTPETFRRTLDWLVAHRVETLTSHIMTPYPGTELYRRLDEAGRITCRDLSKYNTANVVFRPRNMTAEQLYEGYLWMYKRFYSMGNILRRIPRHPAQRKSFIMFNLFYRKFGKLTSALSSLLPIGRIGRIAARISFKV